MLFFHEISSDTTKKYCEINKFLLKYVKLDLKKKKKNDNQITRYLI